MSKTIGFTGTRNGMTEAQKTEVKKILWKTHKRPYTAQDGGCIGADEEFNLIAYDMGYWTVCRPGMFKDGKPDHEFRSKKAIYEETLEPKTMFARNRDIVNTSDFMIATPYGTDQSLPGGTNYTINYAKKVKKPIIIIYPDGTIQKNM